MQEGNRKTILAIAGAANSGKGEVASIIQDAIPCCVTMAYADALKNGLLEILYPSQTREEATFAQRCLFGSSGLREQRVHGLPLHRHITYRQCLQSLGDVTRRYLYEEIWVDLLHSRIRQIKDSSPFIVITDLRHIVEAKALREEMTDYEVQIWRVHRGPRPTYSWPGLYNMMDHLLPSLVPHRSEREMFYPKFNSFVDADVDNSSSLEVLHRSVHHHLALSGILDAR